EIKEIEVTQTDENSINLQERFVNEADFIKIKKWGFWLHVVFFAMPWFVLLIMGLLFGGNEQVSEMVENKTFFQTNDLSLIVISVVFLWFMSSLILTPFLSLSLFKFIDSKCNTKSYEYALKSIKYFFGLFFGGILILVLGQALNSSIDGIGWLFLILAIACSVVFVIRVYVNIYKAFNELSVVSGLKSFVVFIVLWLIGNFIIFTNFIGFIFLIYAWLKIKQLKILNSER
ncbi:MAG: hypothetical protein II923_04070, partial [Campylobacter sp.]|nr:hypothetical protein [Campylobacter sp.]